MKTETNRLKLILNRLTISIATDFLLLPTSAVAFINHILLLLLFVFIWSFTHWEIIVIYRSHLRIVLMNSNAVTSREGMTKNQQEKKTIRLVWFLSMASRKVQMLSYVINKIRQIMIYRLREDATKDELLKAAISEARSGAPIFIK